MKEPLGISEMRRLERKQTSWIWEGVLKPGALTLFVAQWKTGKTTLLSHLLSRMHTGGPFLGLNTRPARPYVVSEEECDLWTGRDERTPFGTDILFDCRPFDWPPTRPQWNEWFKKIMYRMKMGRHDLLVIDPVSGLLPIKDEGHAASIIEALAPLRLLTSQGCSVLLLHHPSKEGTGEGKLARGSGAWSGLADIVMEMRKSDAKDPLDRRRVLTGHSRYDETPRRLVVELAADGSGYVLPDPACDPGYADNWEVLQSVLEGAEGWLTRDRILADWPADHDRPHRGTLSRWLARARDENRIAIQGTGLRGKPFLYALPGRESQA